MAADADRRRRRPWSAWRCTKFARADLDERFAVVAGVGKDVFVLDDLKIVDPQPASPRTSLTAFKARLPMSMPQAKRAVAM